MILHVDRYEQLLAPAAGRSARVSFKSAVMRVMPLFKPSTSLAFCR